MWYSKNSSSLNWGAAALNCGSFSGENPGAKFLVVPHAVDVPGHQFQGSVGVGGPALVVDGDPSREIGAVIAGVERQHIVGPPVDGVGEVGGLDPLGFGLAVFEQPYQCGLGGQVFGHLREQDPPRVAEGDIFVDLEDRAAVDRQQGGRQGVLALGELVFREELDFLADVFFKKPLGVEQIVLVILLENAQARRAGERPDLHAGGDDLGGHVHEPQFKGARGERRLPLVLHQPEVDVVNGQSDRRLVLDAGRQTFRSFVFFSRHGIGDAGQGADDQNQDCSALPVRFHGSLSFKPGSNGQRVPIVAGSGGLKQGSQFGKAGRCYRKPRVPAHPGPRRGLRRF